MKKKPNKKQPHKHEREPSRARMSSSSKPKAGDRSDQPAEPIDAPKAAPSSTDPQCKTNGRHRPGCDCSGAAREAPIG